MKTIFFDAVGTLFDVDRGVGFQYHRLARKYGVVQAPALIDDRFHEAMRKSPPLVFPETPLPLLPQIEKEWWHHLVRDVFSGVDFPDFSSFFEELYSFFAGVDRDNSPWIRFEETMDVLTNLARLGYPLGIISNFDSRIHAVLASLGITPFFQTITCSSEEGVEKPSITIFKQALLKAGCASHEAVHIGDDLETDGTGATEAGLQFIHINRKPHPNPVPPPPVPPGSGLPTYNTIYNLRDIYNYIR